VLDVACGHGRAARGLARFGVDVVSVAISAGLIARARALEAAHALGISYRVADVAELDQWWDGAFFDSAVCEMAVMDIDDLHGMVDAVAATVRPGGWFVVSMVHPCFAGNEAGLSSWPPERSYFHEGWWTSTDHNPEGVRLRVGSSHRTLSTSSTRSSTPDSLLSELSGRRRPYRRSWWSGSAAAYRRPCERSDPGIVSSTRRVVMSAKGPRPTIRTTRRSHLTAGTRCRARH
jgi:SAM-dependent methyltransferase